MRYDACVPLAACAELEPNEGIGRQTLPTGTWAVYTHVGPHREAGNVISTLLGDLIPKRGLTVDYDRTILAVYLNDPRVTRDVLARPHRELQPMLWIEVEWRRRLLSR